MSSKYVRENLLNYLNANWPTTAVYNLSNFLKVEDLPIDLAWVGVQFLTASEDVQFITGSLNSWRERGVIFLHVVIPNGFPTTNALDLGEGLRTLLRGKRINNIIIERIRPPSDAKSTALQIKGNWLCWAVVLDYYCDFTY